MNKILFKTLLLTIVATLWGSSAWAESYYSEQYSSESGVTGWSTSVGGRFTPIILEENGDYFLSVNPDERNNNGCIVTGTVLAGTVDAGADFTLTFDMRLSNSNNQSPVTLEFKDKANSGVIFSLTAKGTSTDTWAINGSATTITLPNSGEGKGVTDITWCSYKISRKGSLTYLTITNKETGEDIFARSVVSGSSESGGLGNIVFTTKRYNANFAIDNIKVRDIEDGDVPSAVATNYTVKCKDATGAEIASYTIATIAGIEVDGTEYAKDFTKDGQKYIYVSGNETITTVENEASNVITLLFRVAESWSYTAKATDGQQDIKTLAYGEFKEGDAVSFIYPYYLAIGGTLYNKLENNKNFLYTFTPQSNNTTESLTYDATTIENVVFFSEAEDIETLEAITSSYLPERFSAGRGAYAKEEARKIVTLPAGVYKLIAQIMGTSSACTFTFKAGDQTIWENTTSSQSFYVGPGISGEEFTLTQETDIMLQPGGGDGSSSRVTNSVDYIYIQKTGEYVPTVPQVNYYTLQTGVTPEGAGTVTSEQFNEMNSYEEQTQLTLTATANEGYKFKQWIDGDVTSAVVTLSTENPYTIAMDKDANVVAQFVKTYTLTVDFDEQKGSVTIGPVAEGGIYEEGTVVGLHAIASLNSNCQFAGWVEVAADGSETPINASAEYRVTMNRNIHLKAVFETITFQLSLTYDQAQGTADVTPTNATNTYEAGTELTVTATPAEGYEFVSWTRVDQPAEEVLSEENPYTFVISSDMAIKANFKEVSSTQPTEDVIFFADVTAYVNVAFQNGETEIIPDMASVTGGTMSAISQQEADKNLIGKQGNDYFFCMTNNNTFFKVVLNQALQAGDVITANTYSRTDTNLGLWLSTESSRPSECTTKLSIAAVEVAAAEPLSSYTVKADDGLEGATTFYIYRETGKSTYFDEFKITRGGDVAQTTYTLTLTSDDTQGSISVYPLSEDNNTYAEGSEVTVTAVPVEGYEFVNWTRVDQPAEEVLSTENPYTFTISSDITIKANFKEAGSTDEPTEAQVLYSWESPEGTPIEQGGTIAYVNGDGDRLNYPNSGYYTICLNGKKANINDETPSANAGKMVITLDKAVSEGDVIEFTAYINKNPSTASSPYVVFETATAIEGPEYGDEANIGLDPAGNPQTYTVTVPAEAAGSKTITLTRSKAGTNLFITKLVITTTSGGEAEETIAGDANLNGEVTVSDAVLATSFVLQTVLPTEAQFKATDLDGSNTIDMADVMGIVNIILPDESGDSQAGVRSVEAVDNFLTLNGTDISMRNTNAFAAFQMDVTLDEGAQLNDVRLADRAGNLSMAYNRIADNTYRIVAVSYQKQTIAAGDGQLLTLDISGDSEVAVDNVVFVDTKARAYAVGIGEATAISRISTVAEDTDVYTVGGVKTTKLTKGLNVIRSANGEVKKVYVK